MLLKQIHADIKYNRQVMKEASAVGVAVTVGDAMDTFLPQNAFEAGASPDAWHQRCLSEQHDVRRYSDSDVHQIMLEGKRLRADLEATSCARTQRLPMPRPSFEDQQVWGSKSVVAMHGHC
jgi:hypothetical protein